jgi:hypothetical protein
MINEQPVDSEVARSSDSRARRQEHREGSASYPFSFSFFSSERCPLPMFFPLILLSLSNAVALHHPVIGGLVNVAPQSAIIRVEEWLRGKERGGSTVDLHKMTIVGERSEVCLLTCSLSLSESAS